MKYNKIFLFFSNWISAQKKRIGILAIGWLGNELFVYGFDFVLYPVVIGYFGLVKGWVIMAPLSFIVCYGTILFYDWAKKDWLGFELIKEGKKYSGQKWFGRVVSWLLKKSDWLVFLFMSIVRDPFMTVIYLRRGQYNGMSRRDWLIFTSSWLIGNVWWGSACFLGVSILKKIWDISQPLLYQGWQDILWWLGHILS